MRKELRVTGLVFVVMIVCQAGCFLTSEQAIVGRQENLDTGKINKIMILPVLDGRRRINEKINFEEETSMIQELISTCLRQKGYECVAIRDRAAIAMDARQVPFAEPSQIRRIGPEEARWVMIPIVDRLEKVKGDHSRSSLSCYLFDKSAEKLIWEGSASRNAAPVTIFQTREFDMRGTVEALTKQFPEKARQ